MSGKKNRQNNPAYGGERYLRRVLIELLKKIGVLDKEDDHLRFGCGLVIRRGIKRSAAKDSQTKTWSCRSEKDKKLYEIHFNISQSQLTQAYTVYLTAFLSDVLMSFLSNSAPTLEDFDGDFHFITVLGRPLDEEEAAEEIYRAMSFSLAEEWEKLIRVPFEVLDRLSLTKYEGAESKGKLAIAPVEQKSQLLQRCIWSLKEAAPVNEGRVRQLRKLLAGVGKGCALAVLANPQTREAMCVGVIPEEEASDLCPVIVELDGPMKWKLRYKGTVLFQRVNNGYQIDRSDNQKELQRAVEETFNDITNFASSPLKRTLDRIRSKHGAAVIVADLDGGKDGKSPKTVERIETLQKHKKAVAVEFNQTVYQTYTGSDEEKELDDAIEQISSAAAMDGAVIVDLQGHIRYVAAILDGLSIKEGDLARGARFNSIKNFVADLSRTDQVMGIVLSEDGGADIISTKNLTSQRKMFIMY